jgi:selenocysteine lyase/cysteine desulfurase
MFSLEKYFSEFRKNTIGYYKQYPTPYGTKNMIYADWTASGRLYKPIEDKIATKFGPFVGNTHSKSSTTSSITTKSYNHAREIIKKSVNADKDDILIISGFGMTSAINKLQRILHLRNSFTPQSFNPISSDLRPLVIITHMEHHSNYISWLECNVDVITIPPSEEGLVDLQELEHILIKYKNRLFKIGSFTACSNVTGVQTPYHEMAKLMHKYNGICFVDLCASAPYTHIDMHPEDPLEKLDGIFFSPHKFLGGPGSPGILIFNSYLYNSMVPDNPGGGTVLWTNPWGEYNYSKDIETSEDGGTPGFLQTIKAALCIELKNKMNVEYMMKREKDLTHILFTELKKINRVHILEENIIDRMGIISFYIEDIHYNLVAKALNDIYGIQSRGGCSCAGPYGHHLLKIDKVSSKIVTNNINGGNMYVKPGWIRLSIHPMMKNEEMYYIAFAVKEIVKNIDRVKKEYIYHSKTDDFINVKGIDEFNQIKNWFIL